MAELTIAYLESLSTGELIELSGKYDMDIPPDLERVFIIEELLNIGHDGEDTDDRDINHTEFTGLAILPQQYHISFIEALIRDPLWAFVFWEIKAHDRKQHENEEGFEGYCLRVIPLEEDSLQPNAAASFIVTVEPDDGGRYLGFPPEDGLCFKVELCMLNNEGYTVLAESHPFKLPPLIKPRHLSGAMADAYRNPLVQLSGVERFSLVHSEDRLLRPRDGNAPESSPMGIKG